MGISIFTSKELDEIESRCKAATPGPWGLYTLNELECVWLNSMSPSDMGPIALFDYRSNGMNIINATFVAHARLDIIKLLEEIRYLRQRVQYLLETNSSEIEHRVQLDQDNQAFIKEIDALKNQLSEALSSNLNTTDKSNPPKK